MLSVIATFKIWCFRLMFGIFALLALSWLLAAFVRLTVRDLSDWPSVSILYYVTPSPMLFAAALGLMLFAYGIGHRRGAAAWALMAALLPHCAGSLPVAPEAVPDSVLSTEAEPAARYRMLYWNVSHLDHGLWSIAEEIKAYDAEVIALLEAGPATEEMREVWQKHFPEYEITFLGGEILVLVKGRVENVQATALPHSARLREVDILLDQDRFTLMLVDINGRPSVSRKRPLNLIGEAIQKRNSEALLVAGDFNTPRESPLLQPLSNVLQNAFEAAGAGYAPTWPMPLPVLTIDQVWGNSQLHFHACHAGWSKVSDHRPILTEFSLPR